MEREGPFGLPAAPYPTRLNLKTGILSGNSKVQPKISIAAEILLALWQEFFQQLC
jgi:hypothetical protein